MSQGHRRKGFFNYPEARKGPDVPYSSERRPNPACRGIFLVIAAFLMEWRIVREAVWRNTGFGSLRKIRDYLIDYEPWYEPTIVPLPEQKLQLATSSREERLSHTTHALQLHTVADYRALYLSGELTPTDVVKAILPLIRRDGSHPGNHSAAWTEIQPDRILKAAEESTLRYKGKNSLGPLDGIPSAVKDDYDFDGYQTTLGSVKNYAGDASKGASVTSWPIRKLEEAGVIILGKLHMPEFGLDTTGNNPNQGTPLNPFNPRYYTGGSSSGPGYAVGSGIIPIALGSDGGGSIRIPSSYCSVFGLKPTHNRLSHWPGANHSPTCQVQGPIAIDMSSLSAVYEVIAEPHPSTQFAPLALQPSPPITKVLGIYEAWVSQAQPAVQSLVQSLVDGLVEKYGYSVQPISVPFVSEAQMAHALTVLTDAATLLDNTEGITAANKIMLALGRATPATDYLLAQKLRGLLMQHLSYLWAMYPGMIIITPTTACAGSPIRGGLGEMKFGVNDGNHTLKSMEYVWLANFCGLPSLTVPAGYVVPEGAGGAGEVADGDTDGKVPVGLMATGEWCSEDALLALGFDLEAVGHDRRCKPPIWEDILAKAKVEARTSRAVGDICG